MEALKSNLKITDQTIKREEDFELMVERLLQILSLYPSGAKDHLVKKDYESKHSALPDNWLLTLKDVPEIDVVSLGASTMLCSTDAASVKQNVNPPKPSSRRARFAVDLLEVKEFTAPSPSSSTTNEEPNANLTELIDEDAIFDAITGMKPRELSQFLRSNVPKTEKAQVKVLSVYSLSAIYVLLMDQEIMARRLQDSLMEFYEKQKLGSQLRAMPRPGGVYAVYVDKAWHRAVLPEDAKSSGSSASSSSGMDGKPPTQPEDFQKLITIFLIDLGRFETAKVGALRELDPELLSYPILAVPVAIHERQTVPPPISEQFSRLTLNQILPVQFMLEPPGPDGSSNWLQYQSSRYVIHIEGTNTADNIEQWIQRIPDIVIVRQPSPTRDILLPQQPSASSDPQQSQGPKSTLNKGNSLSNKRGTDENSAPATTRKAAVAKASTSSARATHTTLNKDSEAVVGSGQNHDQNGNGIHKPATITDSGRAVDSNSPSPTRPKAPPGTLIPGQPPDGMKLSALITFAPDPSDFAVQLDSVLPLPEYIDSLLVRELEDSQPIVKADVKSESYYAGWDDECEKWYRLYVADGIHDHGVMGFLVDWGEFRFFTFDHLRKLPNQSFVISEMMVTKCVMCDVTPMNGSKFWSPSVGQAFSERVQGKTLVLERISANSNGSTENNKNDYNGNGGTLSITTWETPRSPGKLPKLFVRLWDEDAAEYISDWMIKEGLAALKA